MWVLKQKRTDLFLVTGWRCIMVKRPWRWRTRRIGDLYGLGLTFLKVEAGVILKGTEVNIRIIQFMRVCSWEFEDSITIHMCYICVCDYIYIDTHYSWQSPSQHQYVFFSFATIPDVCFTAKCVSFESCQHDMGVPIFSVGSRISKAIQLLMKEMHQLTTSWYT